MRKLLASIGFVLLGLTVIGQTVDRIDPMHWWVGMNNPELHLILHGKNISNAEVSLKYKGVEIQNVRSTANPNYLFIDLLIEKDAAPGNLKFNLKWSNKSKISLGYELKKRDSSYAVQGVDASDLIYLIMPDRFANGDTTNDIVAGMQQTTVDRNDPYARHGGDLKGIYNHIDYLDNLGVTTLWLNPFEENNEDHESYHGYAITDHYAVDPRLGDLEDYRTLVNELHERDMKIIRDVVYNHFGDQHYLVTDLPDSSWIHVWDTLTKSNFRATVLMDPYASELDQKIFSDGWFDRHMPDMNQTNLDLANFLIQQSIWWIEEFRIDAYRVDTYAYPDQDFMGKLNKAILNEYPDFFIFAETWVHGPGVQNFFVSQGAAQSTENYLPSVTDFQMSYALNNMASQGFGWTNGVASVYYCLVNDMLYPNPMDLVTFVDNHDVPRFYGVAGKDLRKYKVGYGMLFTLRGIPQVLYGSEVLMASTGGHGEIREDFWGGWPSDSINLFSADGRSGQVKEAYDFTAQLAQWRKNNEAITKGTTVQFVPENGVYVYFRVHLKQKVMVVVNTNDSAYKLKMSRFEELYGKFNSKLNVITGETTHYSAYESLDPWSISIYEIQ